MRWISASVGISPRLVRAARSRSESSLEPESPAERSFSSEDRRRSLAAQLLIDDRLAQGAEDAGRALQLHAEGAGALDQTPERGVLGLQMIDGSRRIEAESSVSVERGRSPARLEREQP
jgi:hypothetical protein